MLEEREEMLEDNARIKEIDFMKNEHMLNRIGAVEKYRDKLISRADQLITENKDRRDRNYRLMLEEKGTSVIFVDSDDDMFGLDYDLNHSDSVMSSNIHGDLSLKSSDYLPMGYNIFVDYKNKPNSRKFSGEVEFFITTRQRYNNILARRKVRGNMVIIEEE